MQALVIDDSRAMRRIVGGILADMGYQVEQAGNGQEALDVLASGIVPDLACVDWNMPVMDGLEFVNAVRENPAWRDMTLMMVTTESEHGQIVRALAAGAHEYLIKPFTPDALRDKLSLLGLIPADPEPEPEPEPEAVVEEPAVEEAPAVPASEVLPEESVRAIVDEIWGSLVGEDEVLVPLEGDLPAETVSAWVDIDGPWSGRVVLSCAPSVAEALTRCLLREHAPEALDPEDVQDGFGELSNVVGGGLKALLPDASSLSLPRFSVTPPEHGVDAYVVTSLWRGERFDITISSVRRTA